MGVGQKNHPVAMPCTVEDWVEVVWSQWSHSYVGTSQQRYAVDYWQEQGRKEPLPTEPSSLLWHQLSHGTTHHLRFRLPTATPSTPHAALFCVSIARSGSIQAEPSIRWPCTVPAQPPSAFLAVWENLHSSLPTARHVVQHTAPLS